MGMTMEVKCCATHGGMQQKHNNNQHKEAINFYKKYN